MKKKDEISKPDSCLNKATDEEILFVLLERDPAAPAAIRKWIAERLRLGLNVPGDKKIMDATQTVLAIELHHDKGNSGDTQAAQKATPQGNSG